MARVTSKLQVSIPKRIADECGIAPGDEIDFVLSGGSIRVVRSGKRASTPTTDERLELFDRATARQKARQRGNPRSGEGGSGGRGWSRDTLYDRGRTR
jgi:AbrB family looped-hinge helix DNA binding protein